MTKFENSWVIHTGEGLTESNALPYGYPNYSKINHYSPISL